MFKLPSGAAVDRDIRLLFSAKAAHNAMFLIPVMVPYYQYQIGLSFQELLLGEAIFALVVVAMEVPSGWLADIWQRKYVLMLGSFLNVFGFLALWLADGFWLAITAQALLGIGVSFISGADVALLYDRLVEAGRRDEFRRLEGVRHGIGMYALAAASVIGGLLYVWQPDLPILLTALMEIIAFFCIFFVKEPIRPKKSTKHHPLADIIDTARRCFARRPELMCLYLFAAVTYAITINGYWVQQPYYAYLGIPLIWYGWLAGLGHLLGGLGGTFGRHLERYCSRRQVLMGATIFLVFGYAISGFFPGFHGIPLLLTGGIVWGVTGPMFNDIVNARIPSERRATMLSLSSFGVRLTFVPTSLVIGWAQETWDIAVAITLMPILLIFVSIPILLMFFALDQKQPQPA